ncbi:YciI family protein [Pseudoxanthomonas dokdonensis]|uniref:BolA family transcriptional regulator n=1 Tax=Pseudoxanthomonas dokdonensis TaxID=344882 RepID=A0A0R0CSE0_9GAMM|nr:YciI family protein [Pseudoxanthomonas dokdonensis]KRG68814.1 BolA family transcriptional regulator [Pseudoxanthomonas dokdonensis]
MWYAIEGYDGADVLARRLQVRGAHLARLEALREQGRLLLAGPCPAIDADDPGPAGFSGSIVIAEFESLQAAQAWADADPYMQNGTYERVQVRPFRKVLP